MPKSTLTVSNVYFRRLAASLNVLALVLIATICVGAGCVKPAEPPKSDEFSPGVLIARDIELRYPDAFSNAARVYCSDLEQAYLEAEMNGDTHSAFEYISAAIIKNVRAIEDPMKTGFAGDLDILAAVTESLLYRYAEMSDEVSIYDEEVALAASAFSRSEVATVGAYDLAAVYWSTGRLEEAQRIWQELSFITDWKVIGPFDNDGGKGFDTAYDPEKELDFSRKYKGKNDRELEWFDYNIDPVWGVVSPTDVIRPSNGAASYLVTYVHSGGEQNVILRFASSESYKVWLNDRQVAGKDIVRRIRLDQDLYPVRLASGWNRITVKTCNREDEHQFSLRFTRLDGRPLEGLSISTSPQDVSAYGAISEPPEGLQYSRGGRFLLAEVPDDHPAIDYIRFHQGHLEDAVNAFDRTEEPDRLLLVQAVELNPANPFYYYYLSQASQKVLSSEGEKENTNYKDAIDSGLEVAPENLLLRRELAHYYFREVENIDKALREIEQVVAANPDYFAAQLLKADIVSSKGFEVEKYRIIERLAKRYDGVIHILDEYSGLLNEEGRDLEARRYLEKIVKIDTSIGAYRMGVARFHLSDGEPLKALDEFESILAYNPDKLHLHIERARIYESFDDLPSAAAEIDRALAVVPDDEGFLLTKAKYLSWMGDKAGEKALYERVLEINPANARIRRYLEFAYADERKPLYEQFPFDVAEIVKNAPRIEDVLSEYPDEPSNTLLSRKLVRVNGDGTTITIDHRVIQVLTEEATRRFERVGPVYWAYERRARIAKVYKPDGSVVEGRMSGWSSRFPRIEPGDIIEVLFELSDLEQTIFGYYYDDTFSFINNSLRDNVVYSLVTDLDKEIYWRLTNSDIAETEIAHEDNGLVERTWQIEDAGKLLAEPRRPWADEFAPTLRISTYRDWDHFGQWFWNLVKKQFDSSKEIKEKVAELTAGKTTDLEKVAALYRFVVQEITYSSDWEFGIHGWKPYPASSIFKRKRGDCKDKATVMYVLCNEAGIRCLPVLVRLVGGGYRAEEDIVLPQIAYFNHMISYLPDIGEDGLFLDGTASMAGVNEMGFGDQGAKCVVFDGKGGTIRQIPYYEVGENCMTLKADATINESGEAVFESRLEASGGFASTMRYFFQTEEDCVKYIENLFGSDFAGAELKKKEDGGIHFTTADVADLEIPPWAEYTVALPGFAKKEPGSGSLSFFAAKHPKRYICSAEFGLWADTLISDLAELDKREYDLILMPPWSAVTEVTYDLPAGYSVEAVPEDKSARGEWGSYSLSFDVSDGSLKVVRKLEFLLPRLDASDYPEFREWLAEIDSWERTEINLIPGQ